MLRHFPGLSAVLAAGVLAAAGIPRGAAAAGMDCTRATPPAYPAGLYGGNLATFFVPRGVPAPTGNAGHSSVYDFNPLSCKGALCESLREQTSPVPASR